MNRKGEFSVALSKYSGTVLQARPIDVKDTTFVNAATTELIKLSEMEKTAECLSTLKQSRALLALLRQSREEMKSLEAITEYPPAYMTSRRSRRNMEHLIAHRRGTISALYAILAHLTEGIQKHQTAALAAQQYVQRLFEPDAKVLAQIANSSYWQKKTFHEHKSSLHPECPLATTVQVDFSWKADTVASTVVNGSEPSLGEGAAVAPASSDLDSKRLSKGDIVHDHPSAVSVARTSKQTYNYAEDAQATDCSIASQALITQNQLQLKMSVQRTVEMREVQSRLAEISELMLFFSTKVQEQSEMAAGAALYAIQALENIEASHKHLHSAIRDTTTYRFYMLLFFICSAFFVLFLDFLSSSRRY